MVRLIIEVWRYCTEHARNHAHGSVCVVLCGGFGTSQSTHIHQGHSNAIWWQWCDCPSTSESALTNMAKYVTWMCMTRHHDHYFVFIDDFCHISKIIKHLHRSNGQMSVLYLPINHFTEGWWAHMWDSLMFFALILTLKYQFGHTFRKCFCSTVVTITILRPDWLID